MGIDLTRMECKDAFNGVNYIDAKGIDLTRMECKVLEKRIFCTLTLV